MKIKNQRKLIFIRTDVRWYCSKHEFNPEKQVFGFCLVFIGRNCFFMANRMCTVLMKLHCYGQSSCYFRRSPKYSKSSDARKFSCREYRLFFQFFFIFTLVVKSFACNCDSKRIQHDVGSVECHSGISDGVKKTFRRDRDNDVTWKPYVPWTIM